MINSAHNPQKQSNIAWFSFAGSDLFHHSVQPNLRSQDMRLLQWGHRFGMLLRWVGKTFRQWTTIRAARVELMAMDDRMLNDIGLTRGDIEAVTKGALKPVNSPEAGSLHIANLLSRAGKALRRWIAARNARAKLMTMDEWMLDDIGLTRGDIEAAVSGAFAPNRPSHVNELETARPKDAGVETINQHHAANQRHAA